MKNPKRKSRPEVTSLRADKLATELLARMQAAVSAIQTRAMDKGFNGDRRCAGKVLGFLANIALPADEYGWLYAESAVLSTCRALVVEFCPSLRKRADKLALFDYNA